MTLSDLGELRHVAARTVQAGMDVVRDWRDRGADLGVRRTRSAGGLYDRYVTAVDAAAEGAVVDVLRSGDPRAAVVGEGSGGDPGMGRCWVVDPVDGTTNLVRGDSFVAVTAALLVNGEPVVGATGCPFRGELWSAARGLGAYDVAGAPIQVEEHPPSERRVVLDPVEPGREHEAIWSAVHGRLLEAFDDVELRSAIALELACVATGVFDGLVQVGGSPVQDFAAGILLIREAGGLVRGLDGREDVWHSDMVVAGTPQALPGRSGRSPRRRVICGSVTSDRARRCLVRCAS